MSEPNVQELVEKAANGGTLTDDEQRLVMSSTEEPPTPGANLDDNGKPELDIKIHGLPEGVTLPDKKSETPKDDKQQGEETGKAPDQKAEGKTPEPQKDGEETNGLSDASVQKVKDALKEDNPNLEGFTGREKGLFFDLKAERASRQEAENRARQAEFELAKLKKRQEAIEKGDDPDAAEATVGKGAEETPEAKYQSAMRDVYTTRLELDKMRNEKLPHFDEVMKLADAGWVPENKKTLVQAAMNGLLKGQSPYKVTYEIITSDPRWAAKKAELEGAKTAADTAKKKSEEEARIKAEEAAAAAKALESNKNKIRTSGESGGDGAGDGVPLEYDTDKLYSMSESEFAKLKPEVQEAILRKLNGAE